MEPSIFTQIINGDIPCHKVYEDEFTLVFMDIHPIQEGMVLVIPKPEIANIEDLPEDLYMAVMQTARKMLLALRKVYPDKRKIALQVEGLDVQHVHVKLFPIDSPAEFHNPAPTSDPDHEALAILAEKIRSNIDA
jgi:histidine triad (HIT) family protein